MIGLVGCSAGNVGTVGGTVEYKEKPLPNATVTFYPVKSGPEAYGRTDASGNFSLQTGSDPGAAPGDYIVTVSAMEIPETKSNKAEAVPKLLTPMKYREKDKTDLKATVNSGTNTINLKLLEK